MNEQLAGLDLKKTSVGLNICTYVLHTKEFLVTTADSIEQEILNAEVWPVHETMSLKMAQT